MLTAKTTESFGLRIIAIISDAIIIPGARSAMRIIMFIRFCICVTSFVRRVTREPVENLSMFSKENVWILEYTSARRSAA